MKLTVPFKKLRSIVHIADVHIRLFRRHEEYELAFSRLYNDIRAKHLKDFVIVLAGDIVHAKTDMSPELVEVTSRFLANIADIAPTLLIAGNHDCNLANTSRLDALTPIVNALQHPDLYYVKDSAIVEVADTSFAVCSIFDAQDDWPSADEIDDSRTKVALYHGPVHGATTDANFTITNRHVQVDLFDGYDMVLLGDIHRAQTLQEYSVRETKRQPIVRFVGSLLQQNFGESLDNHGWCLWDVPTRTFTPVTLHNDYGYVTLEVQNGQLSYPTNMPKHARVRLFTGDLEHTKVKKLITTLRKKYDIIELSVNKSRFTSQTPKTTDIKHDSVDLQDISTQNALIIDWLTHNYSNVDPTLARVIERINVEMNGKITHDDQSRNIHWRPLRFTFSNMFSYGENNEIDFSQMNGLYGVFAPNASGKSSIIDSLIFCLYDKTPRAFKGDHIINNRKDKFECQLLFEINNDVFGIKRVGKRKKNGDVKVDVSFWKELENGEQLNLGGEDRRDTNANIRSYVGTYEDFIMTALSSQNSNSLFIDKSHSERKDLLIQFMGLNIFDKLFAAAHDESREIAGILKRFKKSDVTDQIADVQTHLLEQTTQLASAEKLKTEHELAVVQLNDDYHMQHSQKRPVPETMNDWDTLQRTFNTIQRDLRDSHDALHVRMQNYEEIFQSMQDLEKNYATYDFPQLEQSVQQWKTLTTKRDQHQHSLRVLHTQVEEKLKFKSTLAAYTYNPSCDVCIANNKTVIDDLHRVQEELSRLAEEKNEHDAHVCSLTEQIDVLAIDKQLFDAAQRVGHDLHAARQQLAAAETAITSAKLKIEQYESRLQQTQHDMDVYKIHEENIIYNQHITANLRDIQNKITTTTTQLKTAETLVRNLHGKVSVLRAKKAELHAKLTEAEQLEETYDAYNYYMDAVGRDGVPYELMAKTLPQIEAEINNILSQIVDFTITLSVDGKNINGKLNYDYDRIWPLENSSGMERFISSLAIRVALINASNLPKPNFLIADEGFGVLDAEHIGSIQTLLNVFKSHFDFIFMVSHLDLMRDMVDHLIEIKKDDGYSCVSV
jgi:DNA repair exonuclease SbcCD ATPase subunit